MLAHPNEAAFLVRLSDGNFIVEIDGRTISTTSIPSYALHQDYTRADMLCQDLRRRGHRQAVVTSHLGAPVSFDALALATAKRTEVDALPTNHEELDKIPTAEYRRRMSESAFRARVEEIESQPRQPKGRR
jgi:hypothetical protein